MTTSQPEQLTPTDLAPHSIEAEEAVLGSLIVDPMAMIDLETKLTPDDFYIVRNGWVFEALQNLSRRNMGIDYVSVVNELRDRGRLEEVGGASYITHLINHTPSSLYANTYAALVERAAIRRRLLMSASEIAALAHDGTKAIDEIKADAERSLLQATRSEIDDEEITIADAAAEDYFLTEALYNKGGGIPGVPTGFIDYDRLTGGAEPGTVTIAAGRPGTGKTVFLHSIARNVALAGGVPYLVSMEMGKRETVQRFKAAMSGIPSQKQRSGRMTDAEFAAYLKGSAEVEQMPGRLLIPSRLSPSGLRLRVRRAVELFGVTVVLVDYLQLLSGEPGDRYGTRQEEVSYISRTLKQIAREFNIPVIAAAQINRESEARADHRPMLSDLRESGSIEQDADVVVLLYRDDMYNENTPRVNQTDLIIAKHRNGPVGTVTLLFRKELTTFSNLRTVTHDLSRYDGESAPTTHADRTEPDDLDLAGF